MPKNEELKAEILHIVWAAEDSGIFPLHLLVAAERLANRRKARDTIQEMIDEGKLRFNSGRRIVVGDGQSQK